LNWSVITEATAYARKTGAGLGLHPIAATATSGMLGDMQIDWIIPNLQGVSFRSTVYRRCKIATASASRGTVRAQG
jgi:hypothetical protein